MPTIQKNFLHVRIYEPNATSIRNLAEQADRTPTQEVQHAVKKHIASEFVETPKRKKKAAK